MERDKPALIGRTWADLVHDSKTGPKLDAAMARVVDFMTDVSGVAADRVRHVLGLVDRHLEAAQVEPRAIPERVGVPVMQEVALEEREEMHELWAALLTSVASGQDVDAYTIGLVKQLSPDAAMGLVMAGRAWAHAACAFVGDIPDRPLGRMAHADLATYPDFLEAVPDDGRRFTAVARLVALGLLERSLGGHNVLSAMGACMLGLLGYSPADP